MQRPRGNRGDAVSLDGGELKALGPNVTERFYLLRPTPLFTPEPMCSVADLRTVLTLDDLADMHEALDLREHLAAKVAAKNKKGGKR